MISKTSLALAICLAEFTFATTHHRSYGRAHRNPQLRRAASPILPTGWISQGCYTDNAGGVRTFSGAAYTDPTNMTVENCVAYCSSKSYIFAGIEYAQECYCDNLFHGANTNATLSDCNMPCKGSSTEMCGAGNRLNVYWSGQTPPAAPVTAPKVGNWTSAGCYTDSTASRTLAVQVLAGNTVTVQTCTAACYAAGYTIAGAEYADECYCASALSASATVAAATDCAMTCAGNSSEYCGGPNRLNLYTYNGTVVPTGGGGGGTTTPPATTGPTTVSAVGNWKSLGCWSDTVGTRALPIGILNGATVTIETCTAACFKAGYGTAGTEYADECYCGTNLAAASVSEPLSDCSMGCAGNGSEACGGPNRLNVYNYTGTDLPTGTGGGGGAGTGGGGGGTAPTTDPTTVPSVGSWVSLGCYNDSVAARTLSYGAFADKTTSVETCTSACFEAGYPLAGMEYADECYCGVALGAASGSTPLTDCNMGCTANATEACGGPNRLNVYNFTGTGLPPRGAGGGGAPTGAPVYPVSDGLPASWAYNGCYIDNAYGRVIPLQLPDNQNLTIQSCVASCAALNYTLAAAEYMYQCFCANALVNGAALDPGVRGCSQGCTGNTTQACGGPNRLSVYSATANITVFPVPTAKITGLPGNWTYTGCWVDQAPARVLPYQNVWTSNNTVEACLNQCAKYGYPAAGMEFGDECWCGDASDVAASGSLAPAGDCTVPCSGDPYHLCGNPNRLQLYQWSGIMNQWKTPVNTGRYEYFMPGVVVPLVASLGINNKVTFLEKSGTSEFTNSTGAYELDISLSGDFSKAWRTMHVKTDTFCSSALILPDKAARQINIGGWSVESTFGVRLYTPSGSPGVNGTSDWQENVNQLSLQASRWYPSSVLMANGSILVAGGEAGSNGLATPSVEVLPKPAGGPTLVFMDWLARTDPNNLYPFLIVMPSTRIFTGYYNEARLLDPVNFDTVKVLPNMPGSVTSFLAGRSYPMEGAAVLLPQMAPYTDPVIVLVCGGSNFGQALDNCVSIAPEVDNATWALERMPSKRVMPCMAALPDGTFLILNGAHEGVAGFGLANDPNFQALLYDPFQPLGQRISILNTTNIARLYHSEATLLPDGRVLISGSDPNPTGPVYNYPEELRLEVYIPPYLAAGLTKPTYNFLGVTDWAYGGSYQISVNLFQGATSSLRVSLIAATSSTHGNVMGGRTLFPAVACNGNTCTVTAPPNAGVCPPGWFQMFVLDGPTPSGGQWIRIGGDPSQIGNWPSGSDFAPLPGV